MAVIAKGSINLTKIKEHIEDLLKSEKAVKGKDGETTYMNIEVVINNELDEYDNQGAFRIPQTKEERENEEDRIYLGNLRTVWTDNKGIPNSYNLLDNKKNGGGNSSPQSGTAQPTPDDMNDEDLPF